MQCHIADVARARARGGQRGGHQASLRGAVGRGEAARAAVLVHRGPGQQAERARRGAGRRQCGHHKALAAPVAIRGRVQGTAAARRGQGLPDLCLG